LKTNIDLIKKPSGDPALELKGGRIGNNLVTFKNKPLQPLLQLQPVIRITPIPAKGGKQLG